MKELYNSLYNQGLYTGTFEQFQSDYGGENYQELYNKLNDNDYYTGSFDQFNTDYDPNIAEKEETITDIWMEMYACIFLLTLLEGILYKSSHHLLAGGSSSIGVDLLISSAVWAHRITVFLMRMRILCAGEAMLQICHKDAMASVITPTTTADT